MSKVTNYLIIMFGLIGLLTLGGIHTGQHAFMTAIGIFNDTGIGNPGGFTTPTPSGGTDSTFFQIASAALAALAVGSIIIGLFTKQSGKDTFLAAYAFALLYFASEFINIILYVNGTYDSWISYIVALVFGGLAVGYVSSVIDFYQGGT